MTAWVNIEYTGWLDGFGGSQKIDSSKEVDPKGPGTVLYHVGVKSTKGRAGTAKSGNFVPIPVGFDDPLFKTTVGSQGPDWANYPIGFGLIDQLHGTPFPGDMSFILPFGYFQSPVRP